MHTVKKNLIEGLTPGFSESNNMEVLVLQWVGWFIQALHLLTANCGCFFFYETIFSSPEKRQHLVKKKMCPQSRVIGGEQGVVYFFFFLYCFRLMRLKCVCETQQESKFKTQQFSL